MSFSVVTGALAADVATSGTFVVSYPAGKDKGNFFLSNGHKLVIGQNNAFSYPKDFNITLAGTITVTNAGTATWPAGSTFRLQLEEQGERQYRANAGAGALMVNTYRSVGTIVTLGAPIVAASNGIATSQAVVVATTPLAVLNGARVVNGVAILDQPRNVVAGWTGTAVVTVTGTDVYGKAMSEASPSGVALTGKKAFKTITSVSFSANVTAATVGFGDVLGLPVFLPTAGYILKELEDGAAATPGTIVAGVLTSGGSTTTTGDVRGTYDPNAAADGAKVFQLILSLPDPTVTGLKQNLEV